MTRYAAEHAITIAVMGCRVNGPGETDDADLGLWCGPNFVNLKRGSQELGAYPYDAILPRLKQELDELIATGARPATSASYAAREPHALRPGSRMTVRQLDSDSRAALSLAHRRLRRLAFRRRRCPRAAAWCSTNW